MRTATQVVTHMVNTANCRKMWLNTKIERIEKLANELIAACYATRDNSDIENAMDILNKSDLDRFLQTSVILANARHAWKLNPATKVPAQKSTLSKQDNHRKSGKVKLAPTVEFYNTCKSGM